MAKSFWSTLTTDEEFNLSHAAFASLNLFRVYSAEVPLAQVSAPFFSLS